MSETTKNSLGLERADYVGAKSTLCTGCGHDSVTSHLIQACFQADIDPAKVIKVSGIGCSSKTTNYFMNTAHGFNSIHGRMAAVATGAKIVNRDLKVIGISGDGDSASIGLGGLLHLFRRNVPMLYIVENNGVYGLTKGQFSATAHQQMSSKGGEPNLFNGLDLCALAIQTGCTFVARSFSGDAKQLIPLIIAGLQHPGTAFIDVVSPCITYAGHEASTMSYDYVREHKISLQELGIIEDFEAHAAEYDAGTHQRIQLANGSSLMLKKLDREHDVTNYSDSLSQLNTATVKGEILTGLIYHRSDRPTVLDALKLSPKPLVELEQTQLIPDQAKLNAIMDEFR